tara:strand:+ start:219 stop:365 length:147 start_codon:yes stop_codon:yes gene_type:complete
MKKGWLLAMTISLFFALALNACGSSKKGTKCTDCPTWSKIDKKINEQS